MNADVKKRWVEALRSGDYKQTTGQLGVDYKGNTGYCCLGVLCEIAIQDNVVTREVLPGGGIVYHDVRATPGDDDSHATMVPSYVVVAWAQMPDQNPSVTFPEGITIEGDARKVASLSELNDYANYSFDQIADVIEQKL